MTKANINVADDFEIGEKMAMFIQNQTFDEGVFWTKNNFLYCYRQKVTITGRIFHI